ncbi:MAG: hypothetical protein RLZZ387_749 [Chloroflexota bacterium]|jgi:predicted amidohydrolase
MEQTGRPVRVVSISFPNGLARADVAALVDAEGQQGADIIALPETFLGQGAGTMEDLDGPTVACMAELAARHRTYIVCPIDRRDGERRVNTAVLLGRDGGVVGLYDKVFPYWAEFDHAQPVAVGDDAPVFTTDVGRIGLAICFDANFPEVWQQLADRDAELVIWPSAYSAGTTLQAHALMHHYPIVTATQTSDCIVYDITGREVQYEKRTPVNISRVTLDLDRCIFHENFNMAPLERLLVDHGEDVELEEHLLREQWLVLRARRPGVSVRALAQAYGLEELRDYVRRSRRAIDAMRGWPLRSPSSGGAPWPERAPASDDEYTYHYPPRS